MKKIKWFLGEFFVVVSGVLVAFLLNGWWMNIKEAEKEREYLRQIHADIQTSIGHVQEATDDQRKALHKASQLLKSSYMTDPPGQEQLADYTLRSMNFAPAHEISAALSSLVNTGELHLIGNDSLRASLGELMSRLSEYTTSNNEMAYTWLVPAFERFAKVVDVADLRIQLLTREQLENVAADSLSGFPHPDEAAFPEPVDLQQLIRQPEFKNEMILLQIAQLNLYRLHTGFLEELKKTKKELEDELKRQGLKVTRGE